MKPGLGRSIWSVVAGFLAAALLSMGMDEILHAMGIYPPKGEVMSDGLFALATTYRCAFQALGGYLTAHLAPAKPMKHVWILAGIGQAFGLLGIPVWMSMGAEAGPLWYPLALVVTAIPSVLLGGFLRTRASRASI